jgi:hypothetical protein
MAHLRTQVIQVVPSRTTGEEPSPREEDTRLSAIASWVPRRVDPPITQKTGFAAAVWTGGYRICASVRSIQSDLRLRPGDPGEA